MSYRINSFICSDKEVVSYEKRLSICTMSNGFSFSVVSGKDELLALGDVECDMSMPMAQLLIAIKSVFNDVKLPTFSMKETELVVAARHFVWIPMHLFDEAKKRDYIEALHKVEVGETVIVDYNAAANANLVFTADNNLVSAFRIALPGLKVRAQHSKMVNQETLDASQMKSLLMMNVRNGETDFAVFCNRKLQLSNTFDCVNLDEALYYAVNINNQLRLDDAPLTLALSGEVDKEAYDRVSGFFSNVVLYTGRNLSMSTDELRSAPAYRYALILS